MLRRASAPVQDVAVVAPAPDPPPVTLPALPHASVGAAEALALGSWVAEGPDVQGVLGRALEVATGLLGARRGCCSLEEAPGVGSLARARGIPRLTASQVAAHPAFPALLRSTTVVEEPSHPVASLLGPGHLLSVPIPGSGLRPTGHLLVVVDHPPSPADVEVVEAVARHAAAGVAARRLARRAEHDHGRLASVVHSLPNPVVVVDAEGRLAMANAAACEVFGLADSFDVGLPASRRLPATAMSALMDPASPDRDMVATELTVGDPPRTFRIATGPVRAAGGGVVGRVLVLDDVTAERSAEQAKADFTAVIGHELRTPLTVMRGYLATLMRRGDRLSPESRATALTAVDNAANRLHHLIEDLLFVSAVERRPPELDLAAVDLAELVAGWDGFGDGRVVAALPPQPAPCVADRSRVDQVVRHFVANAVEYSTGRITVSAFSSGSGEVGVSVTDEGPGIWSGDMPALFEPFHQLDGSATRAHGGTGIGLHVCRALADLMGGRIECESRLGVGSTFTLVLPAAGPPRRG